MICVIIILGDDMKEQNRTEYKNNWRREHTDSKLLVLPKGKLAEIQKLSDSIGETANEFINRAIDERIERQKPTGD